MALDPELAQSNYADFSGEDGGEVIEVKIRPSANILDLRIPEDNEKYVKVSQYGKLCGRDDFDQIMIMNGIDGLYDNSFEGVVIYNPLAVEIL